MRLREVAAIVVVQGSKHHITDLACCLVVPAMAAIACHAADPDDARPSIDATPSLRIDAPAMAGLIDLSSGSLLFAGDAMTPDEALSLELARRASVVRTGEVAFTFGADLRSAGLDRDAIHVGDLVELQQRDVFLRSGSIFEFASSGGPTPFAPGSLGGALLAGVKLTGREGPLSFGLMGVQLDDGDVLGEPLTVGRLAVDVSDGATMGLIATAGDPSGDGENYVLGGDLTWRTDKLGGKVLEASAWLQQSVSSDAADPSDTALGVHVRYPNDRVRWAFGFSQVGAAFDAALGVVPRRGVREYAGSWQCRWGGIGPLRSVSTVVDGEVVHDLAGRSDRRRISIRPLAIELASSDQVHLGYTSSYELLPSPRTGPGGVVLPAGAHEFGRYELGLVTAPSRPVGFGLTLAAGDFYTGERLVAGLSTRVRMAPGLDLALEYQQDEIELEQVVASTQIVRGRLSVALARGSGLSNEVEYDRLAESVRFSSRLQWAIDAESRLSLGLTGIVGEDGLELDPRAGDVAASVQLSAEF